MPGVRLGVEERETIGLGVARAEAFAVIGRRMGRPTSTIAREVGRNGGVDGYRASVAQRASNGPTTGGRLPPGPWSHSCVLYPPSACCCKRCRFGGPQTQGWSTTSPEALRFAPSVAARHSGAHRLGGGRRVVGRYVRGRATTNSAMAAIATAPEGRPEAL